MKIKCFLSLVILLLSTALLTASDVAVIAHSMSTRMEARNVLARLEWNEVELKRASGILVVCRSGLMNPLLNSYKDIDKLNKDAENQLNIAGQNFHVYIYQINNNFSVTSIKHLSYSANP